MIALVYREWFPAFHWIPVPMVLNSREGEHNIGEGRRFLA